VPGSLVARLLPFRAALGSAKHLRLFSPLVLVVSLSGCHVPEAPSDLNGLARWFWLNFQNGDDASELQAIQHLDVAAGALTSPIEDTVSTLESGDVTAAGATTSGVVSNTTGLLLVNVIHCPLSNVQALLVEEDQKNLHANYNSYERTYSTSLADFQSGKADTLSWLSSYSLTILGWKLNATLPGGARFVSAASSGPTPRGPVVQARAYFKAPVVSQGSSSNYFRQNYQIQVFYERSPGGVVHFYVDWIEMSVGGITNTNSILQDVTLNSLLNSDRDYETHCNDG
jgi:hypothetical protein